MTENMAKSCDGWSTAKDLNKATGGIALAGTVRHPGVCVIAPFVDDDHIALMRQYRYAADSELWELPAGTLNGAKRING